MKALVLLVADMKRILAGIVCVIGFGSSAAAQDITQLEKVSSVASFTKTEKAVTFDYLKEKRGPSKSSNHDLDQDYLH